MFYINILVKEMEISINLMFGAICSISFWKLYKHFQQPQATTDQHTDIIITALYQQSSQNKYIQQQYPKYPLNQSELQFNEHAIKQPKLTHKQELQKLLSFINIDKNQTFQQCKKATFLIFCYTFHNLMLENRLFKQNRNKHDRKTKQSMYKYLKLLIAELQNLKLVITNSKTKCQQLIKSDTIIFTKYKKQLKQFKNQLRNKYLSNASQILLLNEIQIQKVIESQIYYLQHQSLNLINRISQSIYNWPKHDKVKVIKMTSLIIIDQTIGMTLPHIDQVQIQHSKKTHQIQLHNKLQKLRDLQFIFCKQLIRSLHIDI